MTPSPSRRHQQVVLELSVRLHAYVKEHGGEVLPGRYDVYFSENNVVEPDVVFVRAENVGRFEERFSRGAPDLVVEISSPSTRSIDVGRKLALYERFGVAEYWFVDLEADHLEIFRLHEGRYGERLLLTRGDVVSSPAIPGFSIDVDDLLGPP